jgi:1-acyl-sn-glycerol-3-phosphate acyltransferase
VILSNHQSTWETFFLSAYFSPLSQVLKRELLYVPFFGWAMAMLRPIAIDRDNPKAALRQVASQGDELLKQGTWVLIFLKAPACLTADRQVLPRRYRAGGERRPAGAADCPQRRQVLAEEPAGASARAPSRWSSANRCTPRHRATRHCRAQRPCPGLERAAQRAMGSLPPVAENPSSSRPDDLWITC